MLRASSWTRETTPVTVVNALRCFFHYRGNHKHLIPESLREGRLITDCYDFLWKTSSQIGGRRWNKIPESACAYLGARSRWNRTSSPSLSERASMMAALFLNGYCAEGDVSLVLELHYTGDEFWTFMVFALDQNLGFKETARILAA